MRQASAQASYAVLWTVQEPELIMTMLLLGHTNNMILSDLQGRTNFVIIGHIQVNNNSFSIRDDIRMVSIKSESAEYRGLLKLAEPWHASSDSDRPSPTERPPVTRSWPRADPCRRASVPR